MVLSGRYGGLHCLFLRHGAEAFQVGGGCSGCKDGCHVDIVGRGQLRGCEGYIVGHVGVAQRQLALFGELPAEAREFGAAAGEHNAGSKFGGGYFRQFDLVHYVGGDFAGAGAHVVVHFRGVGGVAVLLCEAAQSALEVLGGAFGEGETRHEVHGDEPGTHRDCRQECQRAVAVYGHGGGLGAEIHHHTAELSLVVGEHEVGHGRGAQYICQIAGAYAVEFQPVEILHVLAGACEHQEVAAQRGAHGTHRRFHHNAVHKEIAGDFRHKILVSHKVLLGFVLQAPDGLLGHFNLARELQCGRGRNAGQRASAEREGHGLHLPGRNLGAVLEFADYVVHRSGYLADVLHAPVAHAVHRREGFHGKDVQSSAGLGAGYCPFYFGRCDFYGYYGSGFHLCGAYMESGSVSLGLRCGTWVVSSSKRSRMPDCSSMVISCTGSGRLWRRVATTCPRHFTAMVS